MVLFEFPFNERIRTLLRLEELFSRAHYFAKQTDPLQHHMALITLFEVLEVASRADLKSDLLQEIERQRQVLLQYRGSPHVDQDTLSVTLANIEAVYSSLNQHAGKAGQHMRDSEWLMAIKSRAIIPGGTCEFDLASYYFWQHLPIETRHVDLMTWMAPFKPLEDALNLVLHLLRESAAARSVVATQGNYQLQLGGKNYLLAQLKIDATLGVVPEVSANKYMFNVRFNQQPVQQSLVSLADQRPKLSELNVSFELSLCSF